MQTSLSLQQKLSQRLRKSQSQQRTYSKQTKPANVKVRTSPFAQWARADSTFVGETAKEHRENLVLFASLYLGINGCRNVWKPAAAHSVASLLIPYQSPSFKEYCAEPAPDVCYCGAIYSTAGFRLRTHCAKCENKKSFLGHGGFAVELRLLYGVNETWTTWAFTHAVYYRNKAKLVKESKASKVIAEV